MVAAFVPPATNFYRGARVTTAVGALCPTTLRAFPALPQPAFRRRAATGNGAVAAGARRPPPPRASVAPPRPATPLQPVPPTATHRATRGLPGVRPIYTALITGASGGIGAETVSALGQLYPDTLRCLVVAVRDTDKARERLLGADGELAGNPRLAAATVLVQVELESVASAVAAAEEAVAVVRRRAGCGLDLFVANAGVMACPQAVTEDGFEKQMGMCGGGGWLAVGAHAGVAGSKGSGGQVRGGCGRVDCLGAVEVGATGALMRVTQRCVWRVALTVAARQSFTVAAVAGTFAPLVERARAGTNLVPSRCSPPVFCACVHLPPCPLLPAINHLSHAAMTRVLLPALRAGGAAVDGTAAGPGRAVFVSSTAALIASRYTALPLPNIRTAPDAPPFRSYKRWTQYGESKLANAVWAAGVASREAAVGSGVTAVSVHPGVVATELGRYLLPGWLAGRMGTPPAGLGALAVKALGLKTPPEGAVTSVRAAVEAGDALENGAYFIDGKVKSGMLKMLGEPGAVDTFYDETLAALDAVSM